MKEAFTDHAFITAVQMKLSQCVADGVGVELRFKQEGVVAFVGVDAQILAVDSRVLEAVADFQLFVRIEADIVVDGDDEVVLMGAATE